MAIAIIGGTFNPIHYGHLRVSLEVKEALGFESILFMPVNMPPHKEDADTAPPEARLEMIRLSIAGNADFAASDMEIKRGGKSYTIDTVRELTLGGLSVAIIAGSDQFNDISTWCEYEELLKLVDFAVVERPGFAVKKLAEVLPVELARKFCYDEDKNAYVSSFGHSITFFNATLMDISSSDIRRRIKDGLSIRYLVPLPVEEYILKKGLYQSRTMD